MPTALEIYDVVVTETVTPGLHALGLKGSRGKYSLPSTTHWALLSLQRSSSNTADRVRFTVNVSVVSRTDWDEMCAASPYIGKKPNANLTYLSGKEWQERIGKLMPDGNDTWFEIVRSTDPTVLGASVVDDIRQYALPEMTTRAAP